MSLEKFQGSRVSSYYACVYAYARVVRKAYLHAPRDSGSATKRRARAREGESEVMHMHVACWVIAVAHCIALEFQDNYKLCRRNNNGNNFTVNHRQL